MGHLSIHSRMQCMMKRNGHFVELHAFNQKSSASSFFLLGMQNIFAHVNDEWLCRMYSQQCRSNSDISEAFASRSGKKKQNRYGKRGSHRCSRIFRNLHPALLYSKCQWQCYRSSISSILKQMSLFFTMAMFYVTVKEVPNYIGDQKIEKYYQYWHFLRMIWVLFFVIEPCVCMYFPHWRLPADTDGWTHKSK